jgi:hypothetical protein
MGLSFAMTDKRGHIKGKTGQDDIIREIEGRLDALDTVQTYQNSKLLELEQAQTDDENEFEEYRRLVQRAYDILGDFLGR